MPSKQVTDRQKGATAVVAAIDTHGAAAAQIIPGPAPRDPISNDGVD